MPYEKSEWTSISIPKLWIKRIRDLIIWTGHPSASEYVRAAISQKMREDKLEMESEQEE